MTTGGEAAISTVEATPAISPPVARRSVRWRRAKAPIVQSPPRIFGVQTGSKSRAQKEGTSSTTQRKFENPSTGGRPGWETKPCPAATLRA